MTVPVVSQRTCKGWRNMKFLAGVRGDWWWPPVTYDSGYMQTDVSSLDGLEVRVVKEAFGPDPDEAASSFIAEFGGGVSFPAHLTYENREKERRSASFDSHKVEFIPRQTGNERRARPGGRRVFAEDAKMLSISIVQREREL